jgi:hypothetical protein
MLENPKRKHRWNCFVNKLKELQYILLPSIYLRLIASFICIVGVTGLFYLISNNVCMQKHEAYLWKYFQAGFCFICSNYFCGFSELSFMWVQAWFCGWGFINYGLEAINDHRSFFGFSYRFSFLGGVIWTSNNS